VSWEQRQRGAGQRYYYRARKVRGKVIKEYVGTGAEAERAAEADAKARADREAVRERVRNAAMKLAPAEALTKQMDQATVLLAHAVLYCSGFHRTIAYQWRFRRGG